MIKRLLVFFLLIFSLTSCIKDKNQSSQENNINSGENLKTQKLYLGFVSTECPYCVETMSDIDKFYNDYKDQVKIQLIVTNGKLMPGNYSVPQDLSQPLTYKDATGEECGYVPSYVIYNENKEITHKVCGGKLTYDQLKEILITDNNLINNNNDMQNFQTQGFQEGDIGVIMTTSNGKMEIKLFPELAPKTVYNFLALSNNGYYDGITFHRVIKDFMIQGGDPDGTGMGGSSIYGETFEDEFYSELSNIRGSLSMANSGPNTNGSQFFINQKDNTFLDYNKEPLTSKHTVFGQVINGLDNLDKIASVQTDSSDKPLKEVKIIKMEIVEFQNGKLKEYNFNIDNEKIKFENISNQIKEQYNQELLQKRELNENREVAVGDKISVHYELHLEDGTLVDSSYSRSTPFNFTVGEGQTIVGFDNGVLGMKIGEKKELFIIPEEGYGEYDETKVDEVKKEDLQDFVDNGIKLEIGEKLPTMYGNFVIKDVFEDSVLIDMNMELAGENLIFDIELLDFLD